MGNISTILDFFPIMIKFYTKIATFCTNFKENDNIKISFWKKSIWYLVLLKFVILPNDIRSTSMLQKFYKKQNLIHIIKGNLVNESKKVEGNCECLVYKIAEIFLRLILIIE
jgi:hypothetical protein